MRKKEGYADSYIDKHVGAARTMINRAFENGKINGDGLKPFRLVKRLLKNSRANARDRILSAEEYAGIMKSLPLHLKPIWAMGYLTGMRLEEILSLTWEKLDLKAGFVYLDAADTKTKKKRSIPILDELSGYLEQLPKALHDDHVFLYRGKRIKDIRTGLKKACEKANVPYGRNTKAGITFHDLRHTFNTNMRKAGVAESVIMEITGHETREMFDRYNTVDNIDKKQGLDQLKNFLGDQTGEKGSEVTPMLP
jgi:integrase